MKALKIATTIFGLIVLISSVIYYRSLTDNVQMEGDVHLIAPAQCVIGELVEFDATKSKSEYLKWRIIPETADFKFVDKRAFFSSRVQGQFIIIIAGTKGEQPLLHVHFIDVGGKSNVNTIDSRIQQLLSQVISPSSRDEAMKLSQSFRSIASTNIDTESILEATAKANRLALGDSLEVWKPFLDGLAVELDRLMESGQLATRENYVQVWNDIATSIERHAK